ncbi:ABC transporter ATP-binding protein [Cereibacter sphaeroides]|uniref:ABC transporter ATP-binding protein n=1 Tax=Cereibacter sphaeroides TaxID=1063 RepID=UPI003990725B
MAFLEIRSLCKSFESYPVLKDIDLSIEKGEFVVFVGPSGCGKSTLLRMITGLETPTSGTIAIEDEVINDVDPARRGTAMVFQSYALYPHMTVFQNISFGLRMSRKPKALIRERVEKAAAILRLDKLLDRKPGQLSGGQKQRVAIGRAIVREPRVFLFDEPLSNLDAELRVQMRAELLELHERLGTTMIYVTHDQVEAMTLADKMVVMSGGRIQQYGRPLDLYDDPDNRFVAGFVGSPKMNFLSATVTSAGADGLRADLAAGGAAALPLIESLAPGARIDIGIRPEQLSVVAAGQEPSADAVSVAGRVALIEDLGAESYLHLHLADDSRIGVRTARHAAHLGEEVRVAAPASGVLVFDEAGARLRGRA